MLDREGYRPNVGIILVNYENKVFWGKRIRESFWQFPQGGIKKGESLNQAMYRELQEELGLLPEHVQILGRTNDWIRYTVPECYIRQDARGYYKGQKQIWFVLRLLCSETKINLRATKHPEFDAWKWVSYNISLDSVIEFKRGVYRHVLDEMRSVVFKKTRSIYLRQKYRRSRRLDK